MNQAFCIGILIYSFALFVVPWLSEFGISRSHAMLAIFLLQVATGLGSPVIGRFLDELPVRWLITAGALGMSTGLVLLSFATAFWQVMVLYLTLLPLGSVLCGPLAAQTLVGKWFTTQRGIAIAISAAGTSLGGFVFPLIIAALFDSYSWQTKAALGR